MDELEQQTREVLAGEQVTANIFPFQAWPCPPARAVSTECSLSQSLPASPQACSVVWDTCPDLCRISRGDLALDTTPILVKAGTSAALHELSLFVPRSTRSTCFRTTRR